MRLVMGEMTNQDLLGKVVMVSVSDLDQLLYVLDRRFGDLD